MTDKSIEVDAEIRIKLSLKLIDITRNLGEIEEQHLILSLQRSRMLSYPQISKKTLELMALRTVIVRIEHTQEYALTKTTRTDEEEIARLLLQLRNKHRLIHIILILLYHLSKISYTIRYSFYLLFHHDLSLKTNLCAKIA